MMEGQIGDLGRGFIKVNLGQSQYSYQVKAWADHEYEFEEIVKFAGITLSYPFTTSSEGFNMDLRYDYLQSENYYLFSERHLLSAYYWDNTYQHYKPFVHLDFYRDFSGQGTIHDLRLGAGIETVWNNNISSRISVNKDNAGPLNYGLETTYWLSTVVGIGLGITHTDEISFENVYGGSTISTNQINLITSLGISF